jgi:hypothetical protein
MSATRTARNNVFKIWLEPGVDAIMRRYCYDANISINSFVRYAIGATLSTMTVADAREVPTHSQIYGRLSMQSVTLRLTPHERRSLEKMASRFYMQRQRSYSRLIRYSIMRACSLISSDAKRPEQLPEPASEDSPLPSTS